MQTADQLTRATDILRRDSGIGGLLDCSGQLSWIIFLRLLDLDGSKTPVAPRFRWGAWTAKVTDSIAPDPNDSATAQLLSFVNDELWPHLRSLRKGGSPVGSVEYSIGTIFEGVENRIRSASTMVDVLRLIAELDVQSQSGRHRLARAYEELLGGLVQGGGTGGEFYTPRSVIKAVIEVLDPTPAQTVYDPAAGTCGFLVAACEHREQTGLIPPAGQRRLEPAVYGSEMAALPFLIGTVNLILHGVRCPHIALENALNSDHALDSRLFDIVVSNPPFGGKQHHDVQKHFEVVTPSTDLLFLQHVMRSVKVGGKAAVVVPEGLLFQTHGAAKEVKRALLQAFDLHTVLSLPAGTFMPFSAVKCNVLFFDRIGPTKSIWYYEQPATKSPGKRGNPKVSFTDFVTKYKTRELSESSWLVSSDDALISLNLAARNPRRASIPERLGPGQLLEQLRESNAAVERLIAELEASTSGFLGKANGPASVRPLRDITERFQYGHSVSASEDGNVALLRISDFQPGEVDWQAVARVNAPPDVVEKLRLKDGDLLITRTGSGAGKAFWVESPPPDAIFASYLIRVVAKPEVVLAEFLYYYLQTTSYLERAKESATGSAQPNINVSKLGDLLVPVPPLSEQREVVAKLRKLSAALQGSEAAAQKQLDQIRALKSALIDSAFRAPIE